jgi:hypothetical protein
MSCCKPRGHGWSGGTRDDVCGKRRKENVMGIQGERRCGGEQGGGGGYDGSDVGQSGGEFSPGGAIRVDSNHVTAL